MFPWMHFRAFRQTAHRLERDVLRLLHVESAGICKPWDVQHWPNQKNTRLTNVHHLLKSPQWDLQRKRRRTDQINHGIHGLLLVLRLISMEKPQTSMRES